MTIDPPSGQQPCAQSLPRRHASGSTAIINAMEGYRNQNGALPAELTQTYPPAAPVPVAITNPPPMGVLSYGDGPYANPDNAYEHIAFSTTRGNLVVTAKAPTYLTDSFPKGQ